MDAGENHVIFENYLKVTKRGISHIPIQKKLIVHVMGSRIWIAIETFPAVT